MNLLLADAQGAKSAMGAAEELGGKVAQTGQETVDQVFLASEKQLRPNRNGNLYLQLL